MGTKSKNSSSWLGIKWYAWSSSLAMHSTTCETSCPKGMYISSTSINAYGVYEENRCTKWNASWYEWANESACLSCPASQYLQLTFAGGVTGSCQAKTEPTSNLPIFVKAEYEEMTGDGSYGNPFGNLVKALSAAESYAADTVGSIITICKSLVV